MNDDGGKMMIIDDTQANNTGDKILMVMIEILIEIIIIMIV
jgi:hypothetical protein